MGYENVFEKMCVPFMANLNEDRCKTAKKVNMNIPNIELFVWL